MTKTAMEILSISQAALKEFKLDATSGQRAVQSARGLLNQARIIARLDKRPDVVDFIEASNGYLDALEKAPAYSSAYAAGLATLERRAGELRD